MRINLKIDFIINQKIFYIKKGKNKKKYQFQILLIVIIKKI